MNSSDIIRGASVLLVFRAENVRSFRDELELSLVSTKLAEEGAVRHVAWRAGGRPVGVLPVAGIFGANASGKSNVVKAMDDMRGHVLDSFCAGSPAGGIPRRPFLLDLAAKREPSRFAVDLVLEGVRHEYGFVLDDEHVREEWAYRYPHGKAVRLFHRWESRVELGSAERVKGRAVRELLRPNALFLSTAASANHPLLLPIYAWFARNLRLAEVGGREFRQALTTQLLDDDTRRGQVLSLLRAADLGITGAKKHQTDQVMKESLRLAHRAAAGDVGLDAQDESLGTLVWFDLVGPVVEALADGSVLLADDLDASLHPALVAELIRLFQDAGSNPRRAQLVFNSRDVTILGDSTCGRLIGRDQAWFTEKRADGSTHLYRLSDLNPRKEEAVGRRYLAGRYGAVPILSRQEFGAAAELITSGDRS